VVAELAARTIGAASTFRSAPGISFAWLSGPVGELWGLSVETMGLPLLTLFCAGKSAGAGWFRTGLFVASR
jgi:hypothetical protein